MDAVLNSNSSSAIVSVLSNVSTDVNPFKYKYGQDLKGSSFANCSVSYQEVQPNGSKVFNSNIDFNLPKAGYLTGCVVKLTLDKDATDAVNNSIGALQISEIQLITQGKVLASQTAQGLLSLVAAMPYESRKNLEDLMLLQTGGDGTLNPGSTTSNVHYVPVLFSCFESLEKAYNLNFCEPLTLRCRMASGSAYSTTAIDGDVANTMTLNDISVFCQYVRLPAEEEAKQIQGDFGQDAQNSKVQWDLVHEYSDGTLVASTSTEISHEIKHNRAVSEMYVVVDSGRGDNSNAIDNVGMGLAAVTVKFEANGQTVASLDGKLIGAWGDYSFDEKGFSNGSYWDRTSRADGTIYRYKYNFGLSSDTSRVFGCASFRELSNPKVTVTIDSASSTQTAARLHVICKCPQLEMTSGESGRVTTSISS